MEPPPNSGDATMMAEQMNQDVLHFARCATISLVHAAVLSAFVGRCQNCGFSLEALGARLGKPANVVGVILSKPEDWSLDTVSDLLLAMDCELSVQIRELMFANAEPPREEAKHG
jgi:hypothetical protein